MLEKGFINEVKTLYRRGDLNDKSPSIRAVGYRQVWAYLKGEDDFESMKEKAIIATRQLAKRQFTWLRKETDATHLETGDLNLLTKSLAIIKAIKSN
jgi:tRNA delta(2)-isopentenylpyrophosphate transferase